MPTFRRKNLPHEIPTWVVSGAIFFITICTANRHENTLCKDNISTAIRESIRFRRDKCEWWPHLFLLMPDHLHTLITFSPETEMKTSISAWKRQLARQHSVKWQDGFFDHRLRADESFTEKANYIRNNPVRAGLAKSPDAWPHLWIAEDL